MSFGKSGKKSSRLNDVECEDERLVNRVENYLLEEELEEFYQIGREPKFEEGELYRCIQNEPSDTSFRSEIPQSELDFWSRTELCMDEEVTNYIPPLTTTKIKFLKNLVKHKINNNDSPEEIELKRYLRFNVMLEYQSIISKERVVNAFKRLRYVKNEKFQNIEEEAEVLKQMELYDKKLNREFYYEQTEPDYYKKLLSKRIRAIKRKFVAYAEEGPCFRKRYERRIHREVCNLKQENTAQAENEVKCEAETEAKAEVEETDDSYDESESESNCSSIYDYQIPLSEVEYFSSPALEEMKEAIITPPSKRRNKLRRLEKRFAISNLDNQTEKHRKMVNLAQHKAYFENYCSHKKYAKAAARLKAVRERGIKSSAQQAQILTDLEIKDKNLHRNYYWLTYEPDIYKLLLAKRRRAIVKKYKRYATDSDFRQYYKEQVYINYFRTSYKPSFKFDEENQSSEDESSLNDDEIPTSEEEFIGNINFDIPWFTKPVTRTKEKLYENLEKFEIDRNLDTPSMIKEKMQNRLALIQSYTNDLTERRNRKALERLETAIKFSNNDPVAMAKALGKMELADKKLDGKFYYRPDEPDEIRYICKQRLRAIDCKLKKFVEEPEFRKAYEFRIRNAIRRPPKEIVFEGDSWKEEPWEDLDRDRDLVKGDSLKDDSSKPPQYDDKLKELLKPWLMYRGSFNPDQFKKERIREFKKAGIYKPFRDTAPAMLEEGIEEQCSELESDVSEFYVARQGFTDKYYGNVSKIKI